ncbi:hypothetical protein ACFR99_03630 [Haloarchaeobius amylolyticus]|uniref:PRC-barrel domain-containing protein n=1 Tax=Haloarchaeobius amylolyticus TaxID=1198296 RepID=A0ABD6BC49_9EURY
MCALFTADDVGKSVESDDGEEIGVIASVDGTVAYVQPGADAVDSTAVTERLRQLDLDSVREITEEAVRLEDDLPIEDQAVDGERYRGLEADPIELAGSDGDPVTPDEFTAEQDEDMEPTDAAVEPDEDMEPTDAAVDPDVDLEPTDEPRRTDPEVEPTDVSDSESTDGESTARNEQRAELEDRPEQKQPTVRKDETDEETESEDEAQ